MSATASTFSTIVGILILITQISVVVLLLGLIIKKYLPAPIRTHFERHGLKWATLMAFLGFLGPLVYSELLRFDPCFYCWYQRIFMFPLALILPLGVFRKETAVKPYGILLAVVGAAISLYHILLQWSVISSTSTPCGVVGQSVSCNSIFVHEFGYITIPMMAFTAFVAIIVFLVYQKK